MKMNEFYVVTYISEFTGKVKTLTTWYQGEASRLAAAMGGSYETIPLD